MIIILYLFTRLNLTTVSGKLRTGICGNCSNTLTHYSNQNCQILSSIPLNIGTHFQPQVSKGDVTGDVNMPEKQVGFPNHVTVQFNFIDPDRAPVKVKSVLGITGHQTASANCPSL